MNKKELQELLLRSIQQNGGKIPSRLVIDEEDYVYSGGQRVGENTLYRYRENKLEDYKEKSIMLSM